MEKEFIPYQQALELKELGFNEDCFGYYEKESKNLVINYNNTPLTKLQEVRPTLYIIDNTNNVLPQWAVSAPLYQQVFKWFREKYGLFSNIQEYNKDGSLIIEVRKNKIEVLKKMTNFDVNEYEKAELECINKLIEIVKDGHTKE